MAVKVKLHSGSGGFLRRTIGFRPEVVEDAEDHDTFAVTGGAYLSPERTIEREWEDATCGRKPKGKPKRKPY